MQLTLPFHKRNGYNRKGTKREGEEDREVKQQMKGSGAEVLAEGQKEGKTVN